MKSRQVITQNKFVTKKKIIRVILSVSLTDL